MVLPSARCSGTLLESQHVRGWGNSHEFETNLRCTMSLRLAWTTEEDPVLKLSVSIYIDNYIYSYSYPYVCCICFRPYEIRAANESNFFLLHNFTYFYLKIEIISWKLFSYFYCLFSSLFLFFSFFYFSVCAENGTYCFMGKVGKLSGTEINPDILTFKIKIWIFLF